MTGRGKLAQALANELGSGIFQLENPSDGWPAYAQVRTEEGWIPVALHLGPITLSNRDRDHIERRFQNPGKNRPMSAPTGYTPLLVGIRQSDDGGITALAGFEARERLGRGTRFSLFMPLASLDSVPTSGWTEHRSSSGERIRFFRPELLPVFVALGDGSGPLPVVSDISKASGLIDEETGEAAERARTASFQAARNARFGKEVIDAYNGRCAMCGLDSGLVQGAHIYPVSAPGSADEVWNGIALCPNHHSAFDSHLLAVAPHTYEILHNPSLGQKMKADPALQQFIADTRQYLEVPQDPQKRPSEEMLKARYQFFAEDESWVDW